jgi:hypothetical protein
MPVDVFEIFNPLTDQYPYWPYQSGGNITWRVRNILRGRSLSDIRSLISDAESMIASYFEREKEELLSKIKIDGRYDLLDIDEDGRALGILDSASDEYDVRTSETMREIDSLEEALQSFFDPTSLDVKDVKEYEYFAAMAAWNLSNSVRVMKYNIQMNPFQYVLKTDNKLVDRDILKIGQALLDAMEYVGQADKMREEQRVQERYEDRIRKIQASQKKITQQDIDQIRDELRRELVEQQNIQRKQVSVSANDIRHEGNRNVRKMVLEDFESNPRRFSSAEKAADHYLRWLEAQNIQRQHRTVAEWIRASARKLNIKFR